jgi:ABC transport system ATP-binding/permease protein
VYLVSGKMAYFGPPAQALEFFGVDDFADIYAATDEPEKYEESAEAWQAKYRESLQHQKYVVERPARAPAAPSVEQHAEKERRAKSFSQSSWRQLSILCRRYLELLVADRKNLALLLLQAPIIGLLLVMVSHPDAFIASRIDAKKLVFMLSLTGVWFGVINSAREICKESAVLRRERLAGLRPGAYLLSKLFVLALLVLVQAALLLGVLMLRVTLPAHGLLLPIALELYVTVALCGIAGISLGLALSAVAATPDKAMSLIPFVLVPQVLFAGVMFVLKGATSAIGWLVSARAGVDALSAIVDLNALPSLIPLPYEPQYAHEPSIRAIAWAALAGQATLFGLVAWWKLRK